MNWHHREPGNERTESALLVGGIGDTLLGIFHSDAYTCLESLTEPLIEMVVIEINPHVHELFLHHPNRKNFLLSWAGLDDFPLDDGWRIRNSISRFRAFYHSKGEPVTLYPSTGDLEILSRLPSRYACIALAAGHPERNLPDEVAARIIGACVAIGITPVFIGRNYKLTSGLCSHAHFEVAPPNVGVNLIDRLTLPGSLRCIENATLTFSCYSSAMLMAQFRKKPVFAVYPDKVHNLLFEEVNNQRFAAMCRQPKSTVVPVFGATGDAIATFLKEHA